MTNRTLWLLLLYLFLLLSYFLLNDDFSTLFKEFFQTNLSQGTTFHIRTFSLLLDHFWGSFFLDIVLIVGTLVSKVNFIANKYYSRIGNALNYLRIPLNSIIITFFRAFVKDSGAVTEKIIKKISVPGYANCRSVLYYSCPAVSQRPKFMSCPLILSVVVRLSKTVGSYYFGNSFFAKLCWIDFTLKEYRSFLLYRHPLRPVLCEGVRFALWWLINYYNNEKNYWWKYDKQVYRWNIFLKFYKIVIKTKKYSRFIQIECSLKM